MPKAIGGGIAYGKQDTGGASKVLLMVNGKSAVRVFLCKMDKQHGFPLQVLGLRESM